MTEYAEVPETIVRHVRAACAHLPEAYEEQAFAGVRWRIRGRTLAHVVTIDDARDLVTVLWFHAASEDDVSSPAIAALLEMAGPVFGQRVLDLACGQGVVARELARRGARVVGLDISRELLDRARDIESDARLDIQYEHGDAAAAEVLLGCDFDMIVCNFGLSDIDDLEAACATVARLLVPGGPLHLLDPASMLCRCQQRVRIMAHRWHKLRRALVACRR